MTYLCENCGIEVEIIAPRQELPVAECENCRNMTLYPVISRAEINKFLASAAGNQWRVPQDNRDLLFEAVKIIRQLQTTTRAELSQSRASSGAL